jgi:Antitoxin of toxin-antitoxin stability system
MEEVSVRELRTCAGQIFDRVEGGQSMAITRGGHPVARLSPIRTTRLSAAALVKRWKDIPLVDADPLRDNIGGLLELNL